MSKSKRYQQPATRGTIITLDPMDFPFGIKDKRGAPLIALQRSGLGYELIVGPGVVVRADVQLEGMVTDAE